MSHSPHSSLSTQTPALLSAIVTPAPVTPPRAPPTPPDSDSVPSSSSVTSIPDSASSNALDLRTTSTLPTSISTGSSSYTSSPDSGSSSVSASSSASSISFVLSAPSWSKIDISTPYRSSAAQASPGQSLHTSIQDQSAATISPSHSRDPSPLPSPDKRTSFLKKASHSSLNAVADSFASLSLEVPRLTTTLDAIAPPQSSTAPSETLQSHHTESLAEEKSFQVPNAPLQHTIPLPDVDLDPRAQPFVSSHAFSPFKHIQSQTDQEIQAHVYDALSAAGGRIDPGATLTAQDHDQPRSESLDGDKDGKTPNVYINGLPPHFPEDQLYALAAPFGEIRSVRTFTRHVRDSESGYGFVLFETVDAAEKCIASLRRYRNLHPTFSKQVHKIPGTTYAQSQASSSTWDKESHDSSEASFKARLEGLQDPTSTNLYLEGLPLSIDEPTLSALVSPHRISSSRFFQTRLSNPPRVIAFVRLETRIGAEEVIERLHGRMVRGWNDPGSRISVRFADTTEQRELRRSERLNREGDSPSRLSLAQASLLNLRGQELRLKNGPPAADYPVIGRGNHAQLDLRYSSPFNTPYQDSDFAIDYSRAPLHPGLPSQPQTPSHHVQFPHYNDVITLPPPGTVDPTMAALLSTLRNNGTPFHAKGGQGNMDDAIYIHQQQSIRTGGLSQAHYGRNYVDVPPRLNQAHAGYTAAEDYILRAHTDSTQRRRPTPLELSHRRKGSDAAGANIAIGLRGHRAQAATIQFPHTQQQTFHTTPSTNAATITEAEFHASGGDNTVLGRVHATLDNAAHHSNTGRNGRTSMAPPPSISTRIQREPVFSQAPSSQTQSSTQFVPRNTFQHSHMRSTTLPPRSSTNSHQHQRHVQHSSMSIPSSNNRHNQAHRYNAKGDPIAVYDGDHAPGIINPSAMESNYDSKVPFENTTGTNNYALRGTHQYDVDPTSPSLVSPALTYTSQSSTALSPATPFFGSFAGHGEVFERTAGTAPELKKTRAGSR